MVVKFGFNQETIMFGLIFFVLLGCLLVLFGVGASGIKSIILIALGLFLIISYLVQLYELKTGKNLADLGQDVQGKN